MGLTIGNSDNNSVNEVTKQTETERKQVDSKPNTIFSVEDLDVNKDGKIDNKDFNSKAFINKFKNLGSAAMKKIEDMYIEYALKQPNNRRTAGSLTIVEFDMPFSMGASRKKQFILDKKSGKVILEKSIKTTEKDEQKAMELTEQDNKILDQFRGKMNTTDAQIRMAVERLPYYYEAEDEEIDEAVARIQEKLQVINSEYMQWFEILLAFVFAIIGYMAPIWILIFQVKMRQLEMEDEVMQFQTIILMLMRIERVNVEIILEWLERYSNIFKAPIAKCVNNYEAGAWEALEQMKEEVSYTPLIRIIESLQAAVEKIPITDAFDELDSERDYYQEKRKESNERLIKRKGMIGKAIGFAPMVCMFVGYLIIPLVFIGLTSMSSSFTSMTSMQ